MSLDLSKDNMKEHSDLYEDLLCDTCKIKLKLRCTPIVNKLNKGFPPTPREMMRLINTLCPSCRSKIMSKRGSKK